ETDNMGVSVKDTEIQREKEDDDQNEACPMDRRDRDSGQHRRVKSVGEPWTSSFLENANADTFQKGLTAC
ncbi:MAG TPA: hypothetical protein VJ063_22125, partial [Verrucomicrobiae bacterium]|nr:hypothetical protein [Verrucomicrobiae bacterium]